MRETLIRLLAIQALVGVGIAAGFCVYKGVAAGAAALYGSAIGLAVSLLLAWSIKRATRPGASMAGLYLGALERMLFVVIAFGVGIGVLNLAPLALIVGFGVAECAYYIAASPLRRYILDMKVDGNNGK